MSYDWHWMKTSCLPYPSLGEIQVLRSRQQCSPIRLPAVPMPWRSWRWRVHVWTHKKPWTYFCESAYWMGTIHHKRTSIISITRKSARVVDLSNPFYRKSSWPPSEVDELSQWWPRRWTLLLQWRHLSCPALKVLTTDHQCKTVMVKCRSSTSKSSKHLKNI